MISFKQRHFKQDVILMLVRWYVAYALSYRDIEELAMERGLKVESSTLNRWVIHYSPQLEVTFRKRHKRPVGISWRMDETYIPQFYIFYPQIRSVLIKLSVLHKTTHVVCSQCTSL